MQAAEGSAARRGWVVLAAVAVLGCQDAAKIAAQNASVHVVALTRVAEGEIAALERGLPLGAAKLAPELASGARADTPHDPQLARQALLRVRKHVAGLDGAKATFFALADGQGVGIRNDREEDTMAGQDLVRLFPQLAAATTGEASFVSTTGAFPSGPGAAPSSNDRVWIAASPVRGDDRRTIGLYIGGWSLRHLATYLHEALKHELVEAQKKTPNMKLPVSYAAIFERGATFTTPLAPAVSQKAMVDLDLVAKTASGPAQGTVRIDDRDFGWAAARVAKLGPDTGIAVLRSEVR